MKRPFAIALAYVALHLALERTNIVANLLAGSASGLGWLALLLFVVLRLAVVWIVPGWLLWVAVERGIERRRSK